MLSILLRTLLPGCLLLPLFVMAGDLDKIASRLKDPNPLLSDKLAALIAGDNEIESVTLLDEFGLSAQVAQELNDIRLFTLQEHEVAFSYRVRQDWRHIYMKTLLGLKEEYLNLSPLLSSEYKLDYLNTLQQPLAESLSWFTTLGRLRNEQKMATLGEFARLTELHLLILNEEISLYLPENYIACNGECEERQLIAESLITEYFEKVNRYAGYLNTVAKSWYGYRLSLISDVQQANWVNQSCFTSANMAEISSYYHYHFYFSDKASGERFAETSGIASALTGQKSAELGVRKKRTDYLGRVAEQSKRVLENGLYPLITQLQASIQHLNREV